MDSHSLPSVSGRAGLSSVVAPAVISLLLVSITLSSAQWVVETNSFRIKGPSSAAGEYDAAIGDVSHSHSASRQILVLAHDLRV